MNLIKETHANSMKDTLLIVDDMPDNISILLAFLSKSGFKVLVTPNGEQGLKTAEYAHPDLILLDVMMPGMDGFEVCQRLKAQEETNDIPIIFMTALADTVDKVKGFSLGAADYITKPIQQEEVLARVTTHLKLHKLQRQLQYQKQQLHEQNQQLQDEITARKQIETSLQRTADMLSERTLQLEQRTIELEKSNMELDAFAHTVAHDLKNPLSGIISLTDLLLATYPTDTPPTVKWIEKLKWVSHAGYKMLSIINALLLLAGISKQTTVTIEPLDMSQIVQQAIQQQLNLFGEKLLDISMPDKWPTALGYAPWVEEIWSNYLSNGLKYGGQPPRLKLGFNLLDKGSILGSG
ncbi:MAG: hypothetical protein BWK79_16665 [Beggiatoa sp. IS2]|nr:MAG: hypothetical protein BWK79_16665 [Beggiatoa sp. IS2]